MSMSCVYIASSIHTSLFILSYRLSASWQLAIDLLTIYLGLHVSTRWFMRVYIHVYIYIYIYIYIEIYIYISIYIYIYLYI